MIVGQTLSFAKRVGTNEIEVKTEKSYVSRAFERSGPVLSFDHSGTPFPRRI
jgi:hypothetical protein